MITSSLLFTKFCVKLYAKRKDIDIGYTTQAHYFSTKVGESTNSIQLFAVTNKLLARKSYRWSLSYEPTYLQHSTDISVECYK